MTLKEQKSGNIDTFQIVEANESNLFIGKISYNSPLAAQLLGQKVNDIVTVNVSKGKVMIKVVNII